MQDLFEVEMSEETFGIEEIEAYWDEKNIESAIPLEIPKIDELLPPNEWVQEGKMSSMEAITPDNYKSDFIEDIDKIRFEKGLNTSIVPENNYKKFPWSPVGKLYMVFGGKNYVATAWAISGSESGIFTAGHCIYDNGTGGGSAAGWATRVMFKAQYRNGTSAGTWYMKSMWTLKGWISKSGYQYDIACCLATSKIRPITGALGWRANYPPNQGSYTSIGYPATKISGFNFDGKQMWQSLGNYINGSSVIQMHNNMTGGCSGGPWSVNNSNSQASGINSFRYSNNPNTMFSPYFGKGFLNLFENIKDI